MPEQHYSPRTYTASRSVGALVRRLSTVVMARFERALAAADFTMTQWIVLSHVHDGQLRTASDIAAALGHDTGALTRVVDQLERRGLLERRRSVQDRRVVELRLTRAGTAMVEELLPIVVAQANAALAPLSKTEFAQFEDFLTRLLEHAQTAPDAPFAPTGPTARARRAAGPSVSAPQQRRATTQSAPTRKSARRRPVAGKGRS